MAAAVEQLVTLQEYLATERREGERYTYHKGKISIMPGGTFAHTVISTNASFLIKLGIKQHKLKCIALNSDVKIEIASEDLYVYPDAGAVCGEVAHSNQLKGAISNPRILIEVTSESSSNYDVTEKLLYYFSLPSVQEYLVIDQFSPLVTLFRRLRPEDSTTHHSARGLSSSITLASLGIELSLAELYEDVEFVERLRPS